MKFKILIMAVLLLMVSSSYAASIERQGRHYVTDGVPSAFLGKRQGISGNGKHRYDTFITFTANGYGLMQYSNGKTTRFQWGFLEHDGKLATYPQEWREERYRGCYLVYVDNPDAPIRSGRNVDGVFCEKSGYYWHGRGLFVK